MTLVSSAIAAERGAISGTDKILAEDLIGTACLSN